LTFDVVGVDLEGMGGELTRAIELSHHVLEIIKNDNVHGFEKTPKHMVLSQG
jgi:hypothetical protein